jgi:hypothetical protein
MLSVFGLYSIEEQDELMNNGLDRIWKEEVFA